MLFMKKLILVILIVSLSSCTTAMNKPRAEQFPTNIGGYRAEPTTTLVWFLTNYMRVR
jgi:hypothetical protein